MYLQTNIKFAGGNPAESEDLPDVGTDISTPRNFLMSAERKVRSILALPK